MLLGLLALGERCVPTQRRRCDDSTRSESPRAWSPVTTSRRHSTSPVPPALRTHARVLPAEKATLIRQLQEDTRVAMIGDGINDAPALMQADVGIAFGSGADIAIESADVIILNQRLGAVLDAYAVRRYSYRKIVQNVFLAFLFNGMGIPAAATGLVHPIWGMVAMAVSVTAIFINSLWGARRLFLRGNQGRRACAADAIGSASPGREAERPLPGPSVSLQ